MFVLSARFGNIAMAGERMLADNQMTSTDVKNLGVQVLVLLMLLPIAAVGDMTNVFTADGKAGFDKVAASFPIPIRQRVLARFMTIFAMFFMSVTIDTILAAVLSALTDLLSFGEFMGIILSGASVIGIYGSLLIFFCILLGFGKESYAQIFTLLLMILMAFIAGFRTIKMLWLVITEVIPEPVREDGSSFVWNTLDLVKDKWWIFVLTAVCISILSYTLSVLTAERKRGVI